MLTYLREKSNSWAVKAILAVMAVGLIFFYGYNSFRNGGPSSEDTVATVNGESITANRYETTVKSQLNMYSQLYGGEVPEFLQKTMRQNILDQMIEERLAHQWAAKNNAPVAKDEIAQKILSNDQFLENGKFKTEFYKTQFRPWFKANYGLDFETAVAEDLQEERALKMVVNDLSFPSETMLSITKDLNRHPLHLKQIIISKELLDAAQKKKEDTAKATDKPAEKPASPTATDKDAEALAELALKAFTDDAKTEALLKPYGIEIRDLGDKTLRDWRQLVPSDPKDANASLTTALSLAKLNAAAPLPAQVFKVDGKFYVYKWLPSTTTPEDKKSDDAQKQADQNMFATLIHGFFTESLHNKATIERNKEAL